MNLKDLYNNVKTVNYFGVDFVIDTSKFKWIATDESGEVFAFTIKPIIDDLDFNEWLTEEEYLFLGNMLEYYEDKIHGISKGSYDLAYIDDWKDTLLKI